MLLNTIERNSVPVIVQERSADCGYVCACMVAGAYGKVVRPNDVSELLPSPSDRGANLADVVAMMRVLGLHARPVKLDIPQLEQLRSPAVLHWDFDHFVVLAKISGDRYTIHDPSRGALVISKDELSRHFTGVALDVSPSSDFRAHGAPNSSRAWKTALGRLGHSKSQIVQVFCLSVLVEIALIIAPYYMQLAFDRAIGRSDSRFLLFVSFAFAGVLALQVAFIALRQWALITLRTQLNLQLVHSVFDNLMRLPLRYYLSRSTRSVLGKLAYVDEIQRILGTSLLEVLIELTFALLLLVIMFMRNPQLALVSLLAATVYGVTRIVLIRRQIDLASRQVEATSKESAELIETVRGIQTIKALGAEDNRSRRFESALVERFNAGIRAQEYEQRIRTAMVGLFGVENIAVIYFGVMMVIQGEWSPGAALAFFALKMMLVSRVNAFTEKLADIVRLRLHFEKIVDLVAPDGAMQRASAQLVGGNPEKAIEVRSLSFSYSEHEAKILRDVSFTVDIGEYVCIAGRSGMGKTTLLRVLMGMLDPTHGSVRFHSSLLGAGESTFAAVLQDDVVFTGSIRENIAMFALLIDDERVEAVARAACVYEEIATLPMGMHTRLTEGGAPLSGGQRQRIQIARALYKNPRILFLDEATNQLDAATERRVIANLRAMNTTVVHVAHRPEALEQSDRVISLSRAE